MDQKHLGRLNQLFEKMLSNNVSNSEKDELTVLYGRFIDEGRSDSKAQAYYRDRAVNSAVNF